MTTLEALLGDIELSDSDLLGMVRTGIRGAAPLLRAIRTEAEADKQMAHSTKYMPTSPQ